MPQIFGCPNCQSPFQVPDDAAGQTFQCPSCQATVEVPAGQSQPDTAVAEVFACPHCEGQFAIDSTMYGQELSCPHCEELVSVEPPRKSEQPPMMDAEPPQSQASEFELVSGPKEHDSSEQLAVGDSDEHSDHSPELEERGESESQPSPREAVFEPQPVDHLLPPRFDVPDPVRFPARIGSDEVILPDGSGGYRAVDANIVTITHGGEVYHLKRLTPEERRRRKAIHNTIAISVAVILIYLTLRTLGLV